MDIVKIGRASDNDVVFEENEVSRHHCELYCSNGRVYIRDLDSTNGTQVNGNTITSPVSLSSRDKVILGHKVEIDWYKEWSKRFHYTIVLEDLPKTVRYDGTTGSKPQTNIQSPVIDIPSNIHISENHEYAEVLKNGDDFQVPFKRNLGDNMGNALGKTIGCIGSILLIAAFFAFVGLIISTCS